MPVAAPSHDGHPVLVAGEVASGLLLIVDHASNHVPIDVDLGIDPALLERHIAIDIGAEPLARALAEALAAPAILAGVSRLVIDLNREEDHAGLVPLVSDGHVIPGNDGVDPASRIARFHRPYHDAIAAWIVDHRPRLIVALHSFTPRLESNPALARPWQVGLLYDRDDRATRIALPMLADTGVIVGDNEPYSGHILNATMNRHAEARGVPYLGFEVRQDLIGDAGGVAHWAARLAPVIAATRDGLAQAGASAP